MFDFVKYSKGVMELMSNFKIDIKRFESLYNVEFQAYFADKMKA